MKKKTTEPNQSSSQVDLTFEEAMKIIATTPKSVVDAKMDKEKKKGATAKGKK
jgi:hypothetical protein